MTYNKDTLMSCKSAYTTIPAGMIDMIVDSNQDNPDGSLRLKLHKAKEDGLINTLKPLLNQLTGDTMRKSLREIDMIELNPESMKKILTLLFDNLKNDHKFAILYVQVVQFLIKKSSIFSMMLNQRLEYGVKNLTPDKCQTIGLMAFIAELRNASILTAKMINGLLSSMISVILEGQTPVIFAMSVLCKSLTRFDLRKDVFLQRLAEIKGMNIQMKNKCLIMDIEDQIRSQ